MLFLECLTNILTFCGYGLVGPLTGIIIGRYRTEFEWC